MKVNPNKPGTIIFTIAAIALLNFDISEANWYGLEHGAYQVGFKTIEQYDQTRTYQPKLDYFGNLIEGERARPIQICIWYPAEKTKDSPKMVYGDYNFPYPENDEFFNHVSRLQGRETNYLYYVFQGNAGLPLDFISVEMNAVRDAPPVAGKFPLLIYCSDSQDGYADNALLCEYLTSYGFIVATTPALGARDVNAQLNSGDLEAQLGDKQVLYAALKRQPDVDMDKIGVFGVGTGGLQAFLFPMRNTDIDAALSMNGSFLSANNQELVKSAPYFDYMNLTRPFMNIYPDDRENTDLSLVDSLRYTDRYNVKLNMTSPIPCKSYRIFASSLPEVADSISDAELDGYRLLCKQVYGFFNARLSGDDDLIKNLAVNQDSDKIVISYTEGSAIPPTRAEFINIVRQHSVSEAVEIYEKFKLEDPDNVLFDEATFNVLGYQLLGTGNIEGALEIFRMNTEAYPHSCNVWDSYTDGLSAAGETERASETIRKAMEVLPSDNAANDALKDAIREHARRLLGDEEYRKYQQ